MTDVDEGQDSHTELERLRASPRTGPLRFLILSLVGFVVTCFELLSLIMLVLAALFGGRREFIIAISGTAFGGVVLVAIGRSFREHWRLTHQIRVHEHRVHGTKMGRNHHSAAAEVEAHAMSLWEYISYNLRDFRDRLTRVIPGQM